MTKRQRAQVVELLRCAADEHRSGIGLNGMFGPDAELKTQKAAWCAIDAVHKAGHRDVPVPSDARADENYRHVLLEAAARVEEGSYP